MKANEAPDRLYLSKNIYSTYLYQVPDPNDETAVEYIRTDFFVEKACEFMRNNIDPQLVIYHNNTWRKRDEFIKIFRKYMKGE